jgi:hypothetical protein
MNKKLRSKLQAALQDQLTLQISEEHLRQTKQAARMAYQSRRQRERIRYPAFLLRQVRFIGAPVWLLQGLLLLCAGWLFGFAGIGGFSNFAPRHLPVLLGCFAIFTVMTGIPFIGRSAQYKMLEMEMATRNSFLQLLLTRILLIGIGNVLLLTVSLILAKSGTAIGTGIVAIYLLLPYLMACCGCLLIQIFTRGRHQGIACATFCCLLIWLSFVLYKTAPVVYEPASVGVWGILCTVCAVILAAGLYRLLHKAASLDLSLNGI